MKKSVAASLVVSLVLAALPLGAEPLPPACPTPARAGGPLAASIDRAVAKAISDPRIAGTRSAGIRATQGPGMSGGGGGTGKRVVVMLVTTAISVGTYYLIMKKANERQTSLR